MTTARRKFWNFYLFTKTGIRDPIDRFEHIPKALSELKNDEHYEGSDLWIYVSGIILAISLLTTYALIQCYIF